MINLNLVPLLKLAFDDRPTGGRIMTLGRQTVGFDEPEVLKLVKIGMLPIDALNGWVSNQETLLSLFGFDEVHSLDVSDYEDCTHLFDLNLPDLPQELQGQYSAVLNGGTLEHIFDVANGIRNCLSMLKPGGLFVHIGPMNNWVDHGFYQFSPTIWFDFCAENGLMPMQSVLIDIEKSNDGEKYLIRQVLPGEGLRLENTTNKRSHMFIARMGESTRWQTPKQGMYLKKHDSEEHQFELRTFMPFDILEGEVHYIARRLIDIDTSRLRKIDEHTYQIRLPQSEAVGGTPNRPFRSRALILENSKPLPYVLPEAKMIEESPPGRFSHRNNQFTFSTTDKTDPRINGRKYQISVPAG